jgi:hypothetical protein
MKSLFIGINYRYTNNENIKELKNAVSDAKRAFKYIKFNYPRSEFKILIDVNSFQSNDLDDNDIVYPSRENIIKAFDWLRDSVMFLHISAHALPKGIIPANYSAESGPVSIYRHFLRKLKHSSVSYSKVFCVIDTCHSGSLLKNSKVYNFDIVSINSCTHEEKSNDINSFSKKFYKYIDNKFLCFKRKKKKWRDVILFMEKFKLLQNEIDKKQSPHLMANREDNIEELSVFEL